MNFEEPNPIQITDRELDDFQRRNTLTLPPEYKAFVRLNNGGRTDQCVASVRDFGTVIVNDFFGLGVEESIDLEGNLEVYDGRIPVGFLPFADDPGGNLFLLALEGDMAGQVFFWDHENEPHGGPSSWRDYPNLYKISDSFQGFLNGLQLDR